MATTTHTTTNPLEKHGMLYITCPSCSGTGDRQRPQDPFCTECFGAGIAPLDTTARTGWYREQGAAPQPGRPDRRGEGGGRSSGNTRTNRYASTCVKCGTHLDAGQGTLARDGQRWVVQCTTPCQAQPRTEHVTREAPARQVRSNRYPGTCSTCGQHVPAEAGELYQDNGWQVRHLDGQCPEATTTPAPQGGLDLAPLEQYMSGGNVRFGIPGGDTRLKVRIGKGRDGTLYVQDAAAYGQGTRYGRQRPGTAYQGAIQDELAAILADPHAALRRYAELTSTCGICARPLEDEASVARGVGPVCAQKL